MTISNRYWKGQSETMIAYSRKRYIYQHLNHVTPGYALLGSACISMLPLLKLAAVQVQITGPYHTSFINSGQRDIHSCQVASSSVPLVLPPLNNLLPPMVLQNRVWWLNIGHPLSFFSGAPHVPPRQCLSLPSCLQRVAEVALLLLLLLSGDIETNPGPVGECLCWL